jgi:hypothetical protein
MLLVGTKALSVGTTSMVIAVADVAQVGAPDTTQSDGAEEQVDLLNIRD